MVLRLPRQQEMTVVLQPRLQQWGMVLLPPLQQAVMPGDGLSSPTFALGDDASSAIHQHQPFPASTLTSTSSPICYFEESKHKDFICLNDPASSSLVVPDRRCRKPPTYCCFGSRSTCSSPLGANETFQLYIFGTNTAIDGTPMQGLTNGATAVGFDVGYVSPTSRSIVPLAMSTGDRTQCYRATDALLSVKSQCQPWWHPWRLKQRASELQS